jgi:hypothetical protein
MAALQRRHDPLYTIFLSQLTNIRTLIRAAMRCLFARYLVAFQLFLFGSLFDLRDHPLA